MGSILIWEDPTCGGAISLCASTTGACVPQEPGEPTGLSYWSLCPRAHARQLEKPPWWEAGAPQLESGPTSMSRKPAQPQRPAQPKLKKNKIMCCARSVNPSKLWAGYDDVWMQIQPWLNKYAPFWWMMLTMEEATHMPGGRGSLYPLLSTTTKLTFSKVY